METRASVRRRLSALSSFYRYCAAHDLIGRVPTQGVARPAVDPDYTATVGLDRDQARALVATADADTGAQALRTAAVVRLLHNALRVDEACAADVADLGEDCGHRVLRVVRKGGRKAKIPLIPATVAALDAYLPPGRNGPGRGSGNRDACKRMSTRSPHGLHTVSTRPMLMGSSSYYRTTGGGGARTFSKPGA